MSADLACRLYIVSRPQYQSLDAFVAEIDSALSGGDVAAFQLRLKNMEDAAIIAAAEALMPIMVEKEVALIINDRIDIAAEVGADGVHLGQGDGTIGDARHHLGHDAIVGVTCHDSRHLAFEAGEAGASYVAFGAFYPTSTKDTEYRPEAEILSLWAGGTEIPSVAIGGITPENCAPLVEAGADFIAASSGVWDYADGPAAAVQAFNQCF